MRFRGFWYRHGLAVAERRLRDAQVDVARAESDLAWAKRMVGVWTITRDALSELEKSEHRQVGGERA